MSWPLRGALLALLLSPVLTAVAQSYTPGELPPAAGFIRTGAEERAYVERVRKLGLAVEAIRRAIADAKTRGADSSALEADLARAQDEYDVAGLGPLRDAASLIDAHWRERVTALRLDRDRKNEPLTVAEARALVNEFFADWQIPEANDRQQFLTLHRIQIVLRESDADAATRQVLRDGVLKYLDAGGGYSSPGVIDCAARALAAAAGDDEPDTLQLAYLLREQSLAWHRELDLMEVAEPYLGLTDQVFSRHDAIQTILAGLGDAFSDDEPGRAARDRVRAAIQRMLKLLPMARHDADAVRELRRIVEDRYDPPQVSEGLLGLLLHFYRYLLADPFMGGARPQTASLIERHLVELLERSDDPIPAGSNAPAASRPALPRLRKGGGGKGDRLSTPDLWELWKDATTALGKRASPAMRAAVERRLSRSGGGHITRVLTEARDQLSCAEGAGGPTGGPQKRK